MTERKRYIVTSDGNRPLSEVEADLRAAGLDVEQSLEGIGVVVGTAADAAEDGLGRVDGVGDVSRETAIDVGPPGDRDTW